MVLAGVTFHPLGLRPEADFEPALQLLDAELGKGLYSAAGLSEAAADESASVLAAIELGRVVGVAIGRLLAAPDEAYYRRFGAVARKLFSAHTVGSLEALAVESNARRRGIGTALLEARLAWFAARGADVALGIAWLSPREGRSAPLYRRAGFHEETTVEYFYREESIRDGWACPADGNPCLCSATLFWREVDGKQSTR